MSEAWFIAAPIVWALPATCISRICRFVTSTELTTLRTKAVSRPAMKYCEVQVNSTSASLIATEETSSERKIDQSASRPPSGVPTTMPRPKASR